MTRVPASTPVAWPWSWRMFPFKCPAAPYEAAMLLESMPRHRRVRDRATPIYAAEPAPMGAAGPDVSRGVIEFVQRCGITYRPSMKLAGVDASARRLSFGTGMTATAPQPRQPAHPAVPPRRSGSRWADCDPSRHRRRVPRPSAVLGLACRLVRHSVS